MKKLRDLDKDTTLALILKELDHVQAILGRYDSFFFLMKQICVAGIFAIMAADLSIRFSGIAFLLVAPVVFYVSEFAFRGAYWSGYSERIRVIRNFMDKDDNNFEFYKIKEQLSAKRAWSLALKPYDIVFYGSVEIFVGLFVFLILKF